MSSKHACYTNNPHIVSKRFYNEYIKQHAVNGSHVEPSIGMVWSNYEHKVYITSGCFTHMRMDGHNGCHCCRTEYGGESNNCTTLCCDKEIKHPKKFEDKDLL